jgi:uncharacterized protein (DUF433 family)
VNDRIITSPEVLVGKPVIRGTRLSVDFILGLLADNWTYEEVLKNYPGLVMEDILACLEYAATVLKEERVISVQHA